MPVAITVTLPPESASLVAKFNQLPTEMPKAVQRGMDRALQVVRGRIQTNRLTGQGPFPPEEHRLGERTGDYRASLRSEPAVVVNNLVIGSIGSPIRHNDFNYPLTHEFGATVTPVRGRYLVYKIGEQTIFSKRSVIPARAPVITGIDENKDYIASEVIAEIEHTLDDVGK